MAKGADPANVPWSELVFFRALIPGRGAGGQRGIERQALVILLLSCLATFVEGLDTAAISYVAPYVQEELHFSRIMFGSLFSASAVGMLVGGLIVSWLGDVWGRRPVIVLCAIPFGALTLTTAFASSFEQLLILRFLSGLFLGGIPPLVFALVIEAAPSGARSSFVGMILGAYALGAAASGILSAAVAPSFGWSAVFVVAGIVTLAETAALAIFLPESPRLVAARLAASGTFATQGQHSSDGRDSWRCREGYLPRSPGKFSLPPVGALFQGNLKVVTPLLWLCCGASALAVQFKSSWTPLIYEALAIDRSTAAIVASLSSLAGAVFGLFMTRLADRRGNLWLALLPLIGVPVLLVAGLADVSQGQLLAATFAGSLLVTTVHFGVMSIIGLSYPTAIRGFGIACVLGFAKIGGISGPLLGGYMLSAGLPVRSSYSFLAIAGVVIGVSLAVVTGLNQPGRQRRFRNTSDWIARSMKGPESQSSADSSNVGTPAQTISGVCK